MIYQATDETGTLITYRDAKRYWWLLSVGVPLIPLAGIALYNALGKAPLALVFPLTFQFVIIPILDLVFGEDQNNPPPEVVEQMEGDPYFRALLWTGWSLLTSAPVNGAAAGE